MVNLRHRILLHIFLFKNNKISPAYLPINLCSQLPEARLLSLLTEYFLLTVNLEIRYLLDGKNHSFNFEVSYKYPDEKYLATYLSTCLLTAPNG
jgi:hypothetical protein